MTRILLCCVLLLVSRAAFATAIIERRIWIENNLKEVEKDQCKDIQKQWRCIFPERIACEKAMVEVGKSCGSSVIPDLPEYVDGEETLAKAQKVVIECLALEFSKKYILNLPRDKMDEYNVCTGLVPRSKPLSANLQKAMDFSKTQLGFTCSADGFLRKCFSLSEPDCNGLINKTQLDCTMKMEAEGISVKDEMVQETGRKITDCALADAKKSTAAAKKRSADKDCN